MEKITEGKPWIFGKKRMVELYSTANPEEKFRIQEAFAQHGIEYKMKVEDYPDQEHLTQQPLARWATIIRHA